MGPPEAEAPRAVSVELRNCYLALPKRHKLFLLGFETAIWHVSAPLTTLPAAFDGLSLLCHGSSRSPTSCFCRASKLLSGTSEAPQAVSIGLRNCYLARFQHPLKPSKASKPLHVLSTAFRCSAMGPPEAPGAVSVGLRNCYLALPKRHKLFLLGFETAIWHVFKTDKTLKTLPAAFDGLSLLCHGTSRGPTSCFCWASKLLSGTFSAPLKTHKTLKTLPAAFDGLSLLCHGSSRGPTSCFCWASKLLSGTSEAPQAVSIGLRNCYLARFQLPLKLSKPSKPFAAAFDGLSLLCHGSSRGPTSCFCWASKLLSGTSEAPQAVSIGLRFGFETASWHVFSLKPSKASKLSQQLSVSSGLGNWHVFQHRLKPTKPSQQLSTAFRRFATGPPEAPRAVSVGLRNCYLTLPKRDKLFLLGFETAIWHVFSTP